MADVHAAPLYDPRSSGGRRTINEQEPVGIDVAVKHPNTKPF